MKKFDQYVSHLRILSRAFDEDLRALIRLQQVLQEKL